MAQLAIRNETRSNEVIELLEMLGGKNSKYCIGNNPNSFYFIDDDNAIDFYYLKIPANYTIFTLEEFLEKFPYKVGDKVFAFGNKWTIIDAVWDGSIEEVVYTIKSDTSEYTTTKLSNQLQPIKKKFMEEKKINQISLANCDLDEVEIVLGDRFELKTKDGKYYAVRKKPKYPKTFIEVLNFWHPDRQLEDDYQRDYKKDLIEKFQDLLYARDAYWKIAGEQMGLDKPWEPDLENEDLYCMYNYCGQIIKGSTTLAFNKILIFSTEEMRDAFYENFKDLIEKCKELL